MQALPPVFFELELYTLKNQSEEKLYPVQVNKEASVPVLPAGSAKVFNVPFSFFPVRFSEFVMLTLESALPAPLLSLISIRSIEPTVCRM